ncbi:MAG TPA: TIM barrel protein, partial [Planctomycetota bacterium]|nr:TIM barrel protein [Planctomycetota bacterium]
MGEIRVGPARLPSRDSPEEAIDILVQRGYDACEIDFEGGFWMDKAFAARLGEVAREHGIALSVHAPIAAFPGHLDPAGPKAKRATGMLDHAAGVALATGAELVVVHPGFLLGRTRDEALASVVEQLGTLR